MPDGRAGLRVSGAKRGVKGGAKGEWRSRGGRWRPVLGPGLRRVVGRPAVGLRWSAASGWCSAGGWPAMVGCFGVVFGRFPVGRPAVRPPVRAKRAPAGTTARRGAVFHVKRMDGGKMVGRWPPPVPCGTRRPIGGAPPRCPFRASRPPPSRTRGSRVARPARSGCR